MCEQRRGDGEAEGTAVQGGLVRLRGAGERGPALRRGSRNRSEAAGRDSARLPRAGAGALLGPPGRLLSGAFPPPRSPSPVVAQRRAGAAGRSAARPAARPAAGGARREPPPAAGRCGPRRPCRPRCCAGPRRGSTRAELRRKEFRDIDKIDGKRRARAVRLLRFKTVRVAGAKGP